MARESLFGRSLTELQELVQGLGMAKYTASQIAHWLYRSDINTIEQMTNLSLASRQLLAERYDFGLTPPTSVTVSSDGTKKYLFQINGGSLIESAYIPESDRSTLCVSSQAGCKMGCVFCMTGRQGFQHNLSAGEIINQIRSIPEGDSLSNVVYMGMGEPLDNLEEVIGSINILTSEWGYGWSPSRITLSTIGMVAELEQLLERTNVHIAVSLHNPFSSERLAMMPLEQANPISDVVELLRRFDFSHQRRVSFEYIMFKGLNDSMAHVAELARLLNGLRCRINLIRFHAIPDSDFVSPDQGAIEHFRDALIRKGFITTIRRSRGEDIQAACGLLSTAGSL